VLVRGDARPEVLLLLRHGAQGFLANMWVFPGGRIDEADGGLEDAGARKAALRETWEEAGILLGRPVRSAAPDEARGPPPLGDEMWPMASFARWVTPATERRRFDTLFFLARVPPVEAVPDQTEVIEARWLAPEDALEHHRQGALALAPPTFWTLEALRRLGSAEAMLAWALRREREGFAPLEPSLALESGALIVENDPAELPLPPGEPVSGRLRLVRGVWHLA
jgi:8-oxo-dGTP pyrophosphatase MutT (NUDIX family)